MTIVASMIKPICAGLLLGLAPLVAYAADQVTPPGTGSILQQIQPVKPAAPSSAGTGLTIEDQGGSQLPPGAEFSVNTIQISGNTKFGTETLHKLVADVEGKTLTLAKFGDVVERITDYYHGHGYPLARAIVPAQTIQGGVIRVVVIEARYGRVDLDNRTRVRDSLLQKTLSSLQPGQAVAQAPLDHALLLLSDTPGVTPIATLRPGEATGTSDLLVKAEPTAPVTANTTLDNDGNRYTGRARFSATVSFIDPLRDGDVLSLSGLTSGGGMDFGSLSYETLLNGLGTRLGGSFSALHYALGDGLNALDAHGTAQVGSIWVKQPFMRTRDANVYGQIQFDRKQLDDRIGASNLVTNRHLDNLTASLSGDWRDALLAGGVGSWDIGLTAGRLGFDDATAELADAATARTSGGFVKGNTTVAYLQSLPYRNALYLTLAGQWSNGNLDSAEKMVAGGPYTVRAYDIGALSGDTGVLGSFEFRHELGKWLGQWQAVAFVDSQHITVNKTPWQLGDNSATLEGAGVGVTWLGTGGWNAKIDVAAPFGSTPELVGHNNSARVWAECGKAF